MTTELKIIKGLPVIHNNQVSLDGNLTVINLLDSSSLNVQSWTPKIAQIEGGGIFVPGGIGEGGLPLAARYGDVVEDITITLTGDTLSRAKHLSDVNRMARAALDFFLTDAQVDPVYLKWHAPDGTMPQYALIKRIDVAPTLSGIDTESGASLVLHIVREPFWMPLPPGSNPILWTFLVTGTLDLEQVLEDSADSEIFNASDFQLYSDVGHLVFDSVANRHEYDGSAAPNYTAVLSKNYIDIPASDIPGDAPALVMVDLSFKTSSGGRLAQMMMALSTIPPIVNVRVGDDNTTTPLITAATLNAGDSAVATAKAVHADGNISNQQNTDKYIIDRADAWSGTQHPEWRFSGDWPVIHSNLYRGRWAAFARVRKTGTGNLTCNLLIETGENETVSSLSLPAVDVPTPPSPEPWSIVYLGQFELPLQPSPLLANPDGLGAQVIQKTGDNELTFHLDFASTEVPRPGFEFLDLVLMKADEGLISVDHEVGQDVFTGHLTVDNTRYYTHGRPEGVAVAYVIDPDEDALDSFVNEQRGVPVNGAIPHLQPGKNNRLYFMFTYLNTETNNSWDAKVRANIIPRWLGTIDFTPPTRFEIADQSDLVAWYRQDMGLFQDDAATSPVTAAGQDVAVWQDQSGNGNHWTQTVAGDRPSWNNTFGNKDAVEFDGTEFMSLASDMVLNDYSVYVIYYASVISLALHRILSRGNFNDAFVAGGTTAGLDGWGYRDEVATERRLANAEPTGSWGLHIFQNDYLERNGFEATYSQSDVIAQATIIELGNNPAKNTGFIGGMAEILIFNTKHDYRKRDTINRLLNLRHGLIR